MVRITRQSTVGVHGDYLGFAVRFLQPSSHGKTQQTGVTGAFYYKNRQSR